MSICMSICLYIACRDGEKFQLYLSWAKGVWNNVKKQRVARKAKKSGTGTSSKGLKILLLLLSSSLSGKTKPKHIYIYIYILYILYLCFYDWIGCSVIKNMRKERLKLTCQSGSCVLPPCWAPLYPIYLLSGVIGLQAPRQILDST